MLLFVVVLTRVMFTDAGLFQESQIASPEVQTLRFEPDGLGGYAASAHALSFNPILGDTLRLGAGAYKAIPLPFAFPFYDASWTRLHVEGNGRVDFGEWEAGSILFIPWALYHTRPFIALRFIRRSRQGAGRSRGDVCSNFAG